MIMTVFVAAACNDGTVGAAASDMEVPSYHDTVKTAEDDDDTVKTAADDDDTIRAALDDFDKTKAAAYLDDTFKAV